MSRRHRRREDPESALATLIAVLFLLAVLYFLKLPPESRNLIALLGGAALFVSSAIALFIYRRIHMRTKQKLRALELIDTKNMDPLDFEKYIAELLRFQGYSHLTLTERYDLGVDIIAEKDSVRWGIQVKRYSGMVLADAVRQVVTGLNHYNCERAMVVTNSYYSRPARELAHSNNCELVEKDTLAKWIVAFQQKT